MSLNVTITVLMDDVAGDDRVQAEHGLCLHVATDHGDLLLDTGQSGAFAANAQALGVRLDRVGHVILSHGHYDHTGGLGALYEHQPKARLVRHPDAFRPMYAREPRPPHRFIGTAEGHTRLFAEDLAAAPTEVLPGVWVTGEIPRQTDEDVGGDFCLDPECTRPDPMLDDQAVILQTAAGPVVLLGCAHAGVINTLSHAAAVVGSSSIYAVLGGMHLLRAGEARLRRTVAAFERWGVQVIAPSHCTGAVARSYLCSHFSGVSLSGECGRILPFGTG